MGYLNTIVACYYSFSQTLILQAEIVFNRSGKKINICGFEDLKNATIAQVAKILETSGHKIIINPHEPLKSELDVNYRVSEVDLKLDNLQQYEDLLASLNYNNQLINSCEITYEKPYKKNSLFLLLQGSVELLKPTFLETFNKKYHYSLLSALTTREINDC